MFGKKYVLSIHKLCVSILLCFNKNKIFVCIKFYAKKHDSKEMNVGKIWALERMGQKNDAMSEEKTDPQSSGL